MQGTFQRMLDLSGHFIDRKAITEWSRRLVVQGEWEKFQAKEG